MQNASTPSRVVVYVDGFNLYYGVKQAYGRRYFWLDLQVLAESLLLPGQHLVVVRYFTANSRNDPAGGGRQADYLEALSSCARVEVNIGRYQEQNMRCHGCGHSWVRYEEKETDVAIATSIVRDAARRSLETAIVVSADSDLLPAMRAAKEMQPTMAVVAAFPPKRHSDAIRNFVTTSFVISERKLRRAQFPMTVTGKTRTVHRPATWQ